MERLLFGISGLPLGDGSVKYNYQSGIAYLKSIGLDAMELPFVRNVNVTDKNKEAILREKNEQDLYLSAHGSYSSISMRTSPKNNSNRWNGSSRAPRRCMRSAGEAWSFIPAFI
jgi:endonuclease IV